jgi:hypothetical protein
MFRLQGMLRSERVTLAQGQSAPAFAEIEMRGTNPVPNPPSIQSSHRFESAGGVKVREARANTAKIFFFVCDSKDCHPRG